MGWQSREFMNILRLAPGVLSPAFNTHTIMAAKKTAKKTTTPAPKSPAKPAVAKVPVAKKAAKKAAVKAAAKSPTAKAAKPAAPKPSPDAIARAAYLIYRRRVDQNLPGDSQNDWLEAERQLGVIR